MKLIKEKGMTVIEIVVSLGILGLVSVGVMGFFTDSFEVQARSQQMAKAQKIAEETFEKLNDNKGVYNNISLSRDFKEANVEKDITLDNDKYDCKLLVNAIDIDEDNEWVIYEVTINVNLKSDKSIIGVVNSTIILDNWDANDVRESFTIEYVVNNGTWIHLNPYRLSHYTDDTKITILEGPGNEPTRTGYDFVAWMSDDGVSYEPGAPFQGCEYTVLTDDIWKAHEFKVTLNPGDGELDESKREIKVIYDGTYGDLPRPGVGDNPGYTRDFKGWYTEEEGGEKRNPGDPVKITEDEELYAQYTPWVPCQYEVTFNPEPGDIIGSKTKIVTYGEEYGPLPSATRTGYNFEGWFASKTGGTEVTPDTIVTITAKQDLYAHWTAKQYEVTYDAGIGYISAPETDKPKSVTRTVTYDKKYKDATGGVPEAECPGYTFNGWLTTGGTEVTLDTVVEITANQTLYADWKAKDKIALTLDAGTNGGTVNGYPTITLEVTYGQSYSSLPGGPYTAVKDGSIFTGWYTAPNGGTKIEPTTPVLNENAHTIYAQFDGPYTVTFDPNGGKCDTLSIQVNRGFAYGTLPEATTEAGHSFRGWYTAKEGGDLIESNDTVTITADQTLYAQWGQVTAVLEYDPNADDVYDSSMPASQSEIILPSETTKNITISTNKPLREGYVFLGWSKDSAATVATYFGGRTIEVGKGTTTLYAVWKIIPVLAHKDTWFYNIKDKDGNYVENDKVVRNNITMIEIEDSYDPKGKNITASWAADEKRTGSVMCYVVDRTKLIIAGNGYGRIMANQNANYMFSYQDINLEEPKYTAWENAIDGKDAKKAIFAKSFSQLTQIDNLELIDFSNTTNVYALFAGCGSMKAFDVSIINTSKVNSGMSYMFYGCELLTEIKFGDGDASDIDDGVFDTSKATYMSFMFANCTSLTSLDLSAFKFEDNFADNGEDLPDDMNSMFQNCSSLVSIELPNSFGKGSPSFASMFYGCSSLEYIDLTKFDTSKLANTEIMFCDCKSLKNWDKFDFAKFDTSKVTHMKNMFRNCSNLTELDLSNFNTANVTDMYDMFNGCKALISLDLSNFNTKKVNDIGEMFVDMGSLEEIRLGPNFTFYGDGVGPEGKGTSCWLPSDIWYKDGVTKIESDTPEEGTRTKVTTYTTNPKQ